MAASAAAPLFSNPGFLMTRGVGDTPNLLFRLHQLAAALIGGEIPARWMPDGDFGYGLPYFTYYASLPTHVAALFRLYGFSITLSLKLAQLTALLAAAGGVYLWARSTHASQARAWLASAAYTFAPFHLMNLYVRGDSLAELWAMSFYPFTLWAAHRFVQRPGVGRAFALASASALLVLTHNISALNFMPFLALYLLLGGWAVGQARPGRWPIRRLLPSAFGLLCLAWGLALSAFFWLPALLEISDVQIGDLTQGYFFYAHHFRGLDLVQTSLFFNPDSESALSSPFSMGLVQAVAAAAGLLAMLWHALRSRRWTWLNTYLLLGLGLTTWMVTPLSAWVWDHLPLVRFTQFPWRFLSMQALFAAMLTACLISDSGRSAREAPNSASHVVAKSDATAHHGQQSFASGHLSRRAAIRQWSLAISLGLALGASGLGRLRLDFIPLTDADVSAARLNLYEYFTGTIGNTVNNEYLPHWVTPRPFVSEVFLGRAPRLKVLKGEASGMRQWKRGASEQWSIQVTGEPAAVALPTHYWPGWEAEVDGRRVPVRPAEGLGWIAFDLDRGTHTVSLHLGRTPLRAAAEVFSLLALLAPLGYAAFRRVRSASPLQLAPHARPYSLTPRNLLLFFLFVLGSLILHLLPAPSPGRLPLSMDFDQFAYLHRDAIRFAGGTQLVRVDYSSDHLTRGGTLGIRTEWNIAAPGEVTFSLIPPSNRVAPRPVTLASVAAPLSPSFSVALPIPSDIPPGVYFVTASLASASGPRAPLTPIGRVRGLIHLAPVWIDDPGPPAPDVAPLAGFGPSIQLLTARTENPAPDVLRVHLLWHALADVPHNYQISLRLRDVAGNEWAASDSQTAYGFYPTHLWRPGEVIPDFYGLPLSAGTPPGDYALTLSLYDPATFQAIGQTTLTAMLIAVTPMGDRRPQFPLTPEVALEKVEFPKQMTQGDTPTIFASWLALAAPRLNYQARWSLSAPDGRRTSQRLELAPGSAPEAWPAGSFILGRVRLGIPNRLAPGAYTLSVTLVDDQDQPVGAEAVVGNVEVLGRARSFTLPEFQTDVGATFGGKLKLWGYSAARAGSDLELTLVWGALAEPGADYKFFVHLFNPADQSLVAQADAMPHAFTYPTALWAPGEVVTDTVSFSLANLAPGAYRLAVGWYDPNSPSLERLAALDAQGQALADDRVILPMVVEVH